MNTKYIGKYEGAVEIYEISLDEYLTMTQKERQRNDVIYMIKEDRNAMRGGKLFGTIREDMKHLDTVTLGATYNAIYSKQLRAIKKKSIETWDKQPEVSETIEG